MSKIRRAIITAGGLNTRFLPVTKAQPKAMLPLVDKPAIQFVVEEAVAAGIEEIAIVTGPGREVIMNHFDRAPELEAALRKAGKKAQLQALEDLNRLVDSVELTFIQQPAPLGLGHAVWMAHRFIGREPFAVLLCDDVMIADVPVIKQLMDAHEETGGTILAVRQVGPEVLSRMGVITVAGSRGKLHRVADVVEKPDPKDAPSNLAVFGRYVLSGEVMEQIERTEAGAGGEIQLTDAIKGSIGRSETHALEWEGEYFDAGTIPGYVKANLALAMRREDLRPELEGLLGELQRSGNVKPGV